MKARHKKTGREITILGISKEWGTVTFIAEGVLHQENLATGEWEIIDESEPTDWSSFRREAAKDILCAILKSDCGHSSLEGHEFITGSVQGAIIFADELIEQLKQE